MNLWENESHLLILIAKLLFSDDQFLYLTPSAAVQSAHFKIKNPTLNKQANWVKNKGRNILTYVHTKNNFQLGKLYIFCFFLSLVSFMLILYDFKRMCCSSFHLLQDTKILLVKTWSKRSKSPGNWRCINEESRRQSKGNIPYKKLYSPPWHKLICANIFDLNDGFH